MAESSLHRRPSALLKKREMLDLDAFKGHLTWKVKNVASQLQVLDVVVNKPFKDRLSPGTGMVAMWELSTNTSGKQKKTI
jgi:hypothetical protein